MTKLVVGVAQARPVPLNLEATVDIACAWIADAGRQGAKLLAFPETFVPCYPFWCDEGSFAHWGSEGSKRLHARLVASSLVLGSPTAERLSAAARDARVAVVIGVNERTERGSSIFNSLVFIDEHGEVLAVRRKLVPTHGERLVWSAGDAYGLDAFAMAGARVGGLVCWEH
jgi:nitrilase